jgi:hypothetical protein
MGIPAVVRVSLGILCTAHSLPGNPYKLGLDHKAFQTESSVTIATLIQCLLPSDVWPLGTWNMVRMTEKLNV